MGLMIWLSKGSHVCWRWFPRTNLNPLTPTGSCAASRANTASLVDPCRLPKCPTHVQPHTRAFARRRESWASRRPPPTYAWKCLPGWCELGSGGHTHWPCTHGISVVLHHLISLIMIFKLESVQNPFHSPEKICPIHVSRSAIHVIPSPLHFPWCGSQTCFSKGCLVLGLWGRRYC